MHNNAERAERRAESTPVDRDRSKPQSVGLTLLMSSSEGLLFCLGFSLRGCRAHCLLEQVPEVVARQIQTQVIIQT